MADFIDLPDADDKNAKRRKVMEGFYQRKKHKLAQIQAEEAQRRAEEAARRRREKKEKMRQWRKRFTQQVQEKVEQQKAD